MTACDMTNDTDFVKWMMSRTGKETKTKKQK